jgi:phosphoserine phosphatase RsbU/P
MVRVMTLLRTELLKEQPIGEAVSRLNRLLCQDNPTCMFATLVIGVLNKATGSFHYANAGHEPIVLGKVRQDLRLLPPPRGIFVGIDDGADYQTDALRLEPGDRLVLYTGGVTEAMDPEHRLFGVERLLDCVGQGQSDTAEERAARLNRAVRRFAAGAPQSDDITLNSLRYLGPKRAG